MANSMNALDFVDGGRKYACRVEAPRRSQPEAWWWFGVAGDDSRYAPFRADADDTEDSVRDRVVQYYEDRISRRALPWQDRGDQRAAARPAAGAPQVAEQQATA
jgi:hypothetical protein